MYGRNLAEMKTDVEKLTMNAGNVSVLLIIEIRTNEKGKIKRKVVCLECSNAKDLCHKQNDIVWSMLRKLSKGLCQEDSCTREVNRSNMIVQILQTILPNRER